MEDGPTALRMWKVPWRTTRTTILSKCQASLYISDRRIVIPFRLFSVLWLRADTYPCRAFAVYEICSKTRPSHFGAVRASTITVLIRWLCADDIEQLVLTIGCLAWCPIAMIAMMVLGDVSEM